MNEWKCAYDAYKYVPLKTLRIHSVFHIIVVIESPHGVPWINVGLLWSKHMKGSKERYLLGQNKTC